MYWPVKDPSDVLDYSIVFEDVASPETITAVTWTIALQGAAGSTGTALIDASSTLGAPYAPTFSGSVATIWLANGRAGESYLVAARVTSSSSPARTLERSVSITIANR